VTDLIGDKVMNSHPEQDHRIVRKFFDSLCKHGPLGTAKRVNAVMHNYFHRVPGIRRLFISIDILLCIFQRYLDSSIDRQYGIDTSGVIRLKNLTIESKNVEWATWYEPMSVKIFKQIMHHLAINFAEFEFIDFGSGKGRVLLLASNYGFKKIIGVEFAKDLADIANKNVAIWDRYTRKQNNIQTICMDAAEFPIPNVPVVIFFYSPFKGKVMEQVLKNISNSFAMSPREILLVFYGQYPETIKLLKATKFRWRELKLCADWSQFIQYRAFLFTT
jgi:hypothetical protein